MAEAEEEREEEEEGLEPASDEDITLRPVLGGESAEEVFQEQQDKEKRKSALVIEVPSAFESTQTALEWVKAIKALEQTAYGKKVSRGRPQPTSVSYDPWKSVPCLVVLALPLEEIPQTSRREEEQVRGNLAEEGAIVFERASPEAGGCLKLEALRDTISTSLKLKLLPQNGQTAAADDPAEFFFRELNPTSRIDNAYGRFPTHIEPLDQSSLQKKVEKGFKEYDDCEMNPWWTLDY